MNQMGLLAIMRDVQELSGTVEQAHW